MMRSKKFWKETTERAVKTLAQNLAASLSVAAAGTVIWDIDWRYTAGVALTATVYSVFTSMGSAGIRDPESPSLVEIKPHDAER